MEAVAADACGCLKPANTTPQISTRTKRNWRLSVTGFGDFPPNETNIEEIRIWSLDSKVV
jgi:hypothetical protein